MKQRGERGPGFRANNKLVRREPRKGGDRLVNIAGFGKCARRIWRTLETGGRKPNVLRGLAVDQNDFEQAVGQLFLRGMVRWNGKTTARLLERKPG